MLRRSAGRVARFAADAAAQARPLQAVATSDVYWPGNSSWSSSGSGALQRLVLRQDGVAAAAVNAHSLQLPSLTARAAALPQVWKQPYYSSSSSSSSSSRRSDGSNSSSSSSTRNDQVGRSPTREQSSSRGSSHSLQPPAPLRRPRSRSPAAAPTAAGEGEGEGKKRKAPRWAQHLVAAAHPSTVHRPPAAEVAALLRNYALDQAELRALTARQAAQLMCSAGNLQRAGSGREAYAPLAGLCVRVLDAAAAHCAASSADTLRHMSAFDLGQLLDGCARAAHLPAVQGFRQQLAAALQHAATSGLFEEPKDLSRVIYAIGSLAWAGVPPDCLAALRQALLQLLPASGPQAIANVVWAHGRLAEARCSEHALPAGGEVQQLLEALVAKMGEVKPQEVSNTLWALAKLRDAGVQLDISPEHLSVLLGTLVARLHDAKPQEVSNTLWALAVLHSGGLDISRTTTQVQALLDTADMRGAQPQEISNTLWALAVLHSGGLDISRTTTQVQALLDTADMRGAQPQHISNTLWALAKLREGGIQLDVSPEHLSSLLGTLVARLQDADPQAISNTLWALGVLQQLANNNDPYLNSQQCAGQLQALIATLVHSVTTATPQNVSNALWALGVLRLRPSDAEADQLLDAAVQRAEAMAPMHIGQVLLGCARLRLHVPLPQLQLLLERLLSRRDADVQANCNAAYATACLLCEWPSDVAAAAAPLVQRLVDAAAAMPEALFPKALTQLLYADQLFSVALASSHVSFLSPKLRACCEAAQQQQPTHTPSSFQRDVFVAAQRLAAGPNPLFNPGSVQLEARVGSDGLFSADVLASTAGSSSSSSSSGGGGGGGHGGSRFVIIEADGPSHFFLNHPCVELGDTVLRNVLLRAVRDPSSGARYALVSVHHHDWRGDNAAKERHLRALVEAALVE